MSKLKERFTTVYNLTYKPTFGYVLSRCKSVTDVEDILQDVYNELYKVMKKNDEDYVQNYSAFVMNIAKFRLFKYYRGKINLNECSLEAVNSSGQEYSPYDISDIDIYDEFENSQTIKEIWQSLREKSLIIQKIFILFYYNDFTIKEIAKYLSLSESNVKHKLYDTLTELRQIYK